MHSLSIYRDPGGYILGSLVVRFKYESKAMDPCLLYNTPQELTV